MIAGFGERLRAAVQHRGPLCVGIDPHAQLLTEWGLPDSAAGAREFGVRVVAAAAGRAAIIKPQVAFFERFGTAGMVALEQVLSQARSAGILILSDVKRGDIGSTMDAYAAAWLTPGGEWESDAITVSPYLGVAALDGAIAIAREHRKGLFVLAATSNPEAASVQAALTRAGTSVAAAVIQSVARYNDARTGSERWGDIGLVIGATADHTGLGLPDLLTPPTPILAPGFGYQGAALADLPAIFGKNAALVLASESRSILSGGPTGLADRIETRNRTLKETVHG